MAIRQWKEILIPYDQAIEELKVKMKSIRKEYRKRNEYSPIEFVTGRVKELNSMLEKASKFQIPLDRIEYELEDIAGIRIMCQFVDDIWKVVDIIRGRDDMEVIYEKDYITNVKESGYRSYHMVIKYPVHMATGTKKILAEIQIRTLAMNFWATIEHSLNYKYKQEIPEEVKKKLKSAADSAYNLDEMMTGIKEEVTDAQKLFEVKSSFVTDIVKNILSLSSLGKPNEASRFREQLNKVLKEGEVVELSDLLNKTQRAIEMFSR